MTSIATDSPSPAKSREFARREAIAKIQWGANVSEVLLLLESQYGVVGPEADAIIEAALASRKTLVRKKAGIRIGFACAGLGISLTYFGIQWEVGFMRLGWGLILMGGLGLFSLVAIGKSVIQLLTGEAAGSVQ